LELILPNSNEENSELSHQANSLKQQQIILQKKVDAKQAVENKLQAIADNLSLLVDDETALQSRYGKNMQAFKVHFPDIYEFFSNYSAKKINLVIHENFANLLDTESSDVMYEYPAYLMALAQVQAYKKSPLSSTSKFYQHDAKLGDFLHSRKLNPIGELLQRRVDSDVDKTQELPKHLNALVIFGVGLGYHLEQLLDQHSVGSVYLIEPCLDTFYASLHTANWQYILESMDVKNVNLHISLGPQEEDFFDQLLKETYMNGRYEVAKTHLYIHQNSAEIMALVGQYKARFFELIQGWGFFDDGIMAMSHFLKSLENGTPVLKKQVPFDVDIATTPVLIVGNGPSLDQHIDFIKQHGDKAVIISCASALSALYKCGIDVDIHCEQERIFAVAEKVEYYAPADYIKKLSLLAPATVHPAVYEKFARAIMAPKASEPSTSLLLQDPIAQQLFEEAKHITPTVANTALVMATKLGFREFYFVGVDLGRKKAGAHHSQHSFYYDDEGNDINLYPEMENEFINLGNFSGEFISDPIFNMSKLTLERFIAENKQIRCFNLSDGVLVKGSLPTRQNTLAEKLALAAQVDKQSLVDKAYDLASYHDDGGLYQRLVAAADLDDFEQLCQWLIDDISADINSMAEAIAKVRSQTHIVREVEISGKRHLSLLISGSILHMQAMLTRLLYEAKSEDIALSDFNTALKYYLEFLNEAPAVYRQHYKEPLSRETEHMQALRKV
jgi:hypothetical protein